MNKDKMKKSLDDAASGIRKDPWLTQKVLCRAEKEEDIPVKRRVSAGTVLIALTVVCLMSVGIAAVSNWNVLDFLKDYGQEDATFITATVQQEAETENARLKVDSVIYNGGTLAFDVTLENKKPDVPVWCRVDELTVNGMPYAPGVIYDQDSVFSSEDIQDVTAYSISDFHDQWLPCEHYPEGIAECGELLRLAPEEAGSENVHVEMRVKVYRPIRPVVLISTRKSFRKEVEAKIAEGYYVIPGYLSDHVLYPEGQFCPEEDLSICPEGWAIGLSGEPPEDLMGGVTVETMEIRFDAQKQTGFNE
ncbi:MAG: hypothetical protein J6Y48_11900 [Clostridia bacterium]|nr:hypothetical protein [Clostridia bacterium]